MKRSEIWMVRLPAQEGSIQGGLRPCIIVSNDMANKFSSVIHIIPLTTKAKKPLRTHVAISKESGMVMDSTAMAEQSMLVDKACFCHQIGELDKNLMDKIDTALMIQFGFYDKIKKIITICKQERSFAAIC